MISLRGYQSDAVDALFAYFRRANSNPILVLPTGSGKSIIIGEIVRRALEAFPSTRILILAHRQELIEQDARAILSVWPAAPVGIYSAGLFFRQMEQVTVAGIQSVHARAQELGHRDLIIVDECDLVPHKDDGMYRTLINDLTSINPKLKVVGVTATPWRLSGGSLCRGPEKLFTSIAYELPVKRLIDEGYLAPLVSPEVSIAVDTYGLKTVRNDWAVDELADKSMQITHEALEEAIALSRGRKARLVFCVSVKHADQAVSFLRSHGHDADILTGATDAATRTQLIRDFKAGKLPWLVSVDVVARGFDAPITDCLVILRPTQSCALWVQACGRGMRLSPGKTDCLVLDYGNNCERHGPVDDPKPRSAGKGQGVAIRICSQCDAEVALHKKECPECGFIFPQVPREIEHEKKATRLKVMGPPPPPEWVDVVSVNYIRWQKPDKPPSVCVEYSKGLSSVRAWVCPEHGGFAAQKAAKWWASQGGLRPYPETVDDFLRRKDELKKVEAIHVAKDGEYFRVLECRYGPEREPGSDDIQQGEASEPGGWVDMGELPF